MTVTDSVLTDFRPLISPSAGDLSAFSARRVGTARVRVARAKEVPRWLKYVMGRLEELHRLAYEPDDEIPTPSPDAIPRSLSELRRFMRWGTPTPSVVPTARGGVQFVWHKGGWDIEIEVGPQETLVWWHRRESNESLGGTLEEHLDEIRALLFELESSAPA